MKCEGMKLRFLNHYYNPSLSLDTTAEYGEYVCANSQLKSHSSETKSLVNESSGWLAKSELRFHADSFSSPNYYFIIVSPHRE